MKLLGSILAVSLAASSLATPAAAQMFYMASDHTMRSTKLVGSPVYNDKGEKIGDIDDIMLPPSGGQPIVVLSVGGFLGIGAKLVKVPLSEVKFGPDKTVLKGGTKATLTRMPSYSYGPSK